MSHFGVYRALTERVKRAGLDDFHPHVLRHTFAHVWLANGGNEGDPSVKPSAWPSRQSRKVEPFDLVAGSRNERVQAPEVRVPSATSRSSPPALTVSSASCGLRFT